MLFNSYEFILVFLPLVLIGFYLLGNGGFGRAAISWLVLASFFFYGWWNPAYLILIVTSMLFNFTIGSWLGRDDDNRYRKLLLIIGILGNLLLIGYYKYANFIIDNVNYITESNYHLEKIILPLAISFFTFQQITYLVDAYRHETKEYNFLHYCLFVTFFPQLIAGPIVHHKEMLPQFAQKDIYRFKHVNLAVGLTIFALGLFKKVVLADNIAVYASPVFSAAEQGQSLTFFEAWVGALSYTFQLYFDFSGYSDMAIGAARMFGIRLPLNFNSPYKSLNIIDFWRRWHMTLSRFLRDYLYIPLGGSRKGSYRRHVNLMATMLIGGLWHGAGWPFIFWGFLHGTYLVINHTWRSVMTKAGFYDSDSTWIGRRTAQLITFIAVVVAWVFFRAETFAGAQQVLAGMAGLNGVTVPASALGTLNKVMGFGDMLANAGLTYSADAMVLLQGDNRIIQLLLLFIIALIMPNTHEYMEKFKPVFDMQSIQYNARYKINWNGHWVWALLITPVAFFCILSLGNVSEFLYFQF
ncbi:MBOAT family O-acyltransferase [Oceanicoccus sagamiensis]|uniref:Probable alginate O-acetylase n=1 Tax=Oceanicoccus sagamiensis TaxID=716816 RepID=A0A1X9NAL0_9GAMM|nr:MBOAT family protein [Oceanicoccus sagamiensis]ARN74094.1 membrane-bound O-acyltransferase family protein [Oceanicoccus sagamiensis]